MTRSVPDRSRRRDGMGSVDAVHAWAYSFCKVLLHMNGDHASTTFTDESGKVWAASGNAQIDKTLSKFGGACGNFDGTGDYISTGDHADFTPAGDFTFHFWVRYTALPGIGSAWALFDHYVDASNNYRFYLLNNGGTLQYVFQVNTTAGGLIISVIKNAAATVTGVWYHITLVRTGNDYMIFQDGVQIGTTVTDADAIPDFAGSFYIGTYPGGLSNLNGRIDEFVYLKGLARWTANFTPPTAEQEFIGV